MTPHRQFRPERHTWTLPREYLVRFLTEDAPYGDITSCALFDHEQCIATVRVHQGGIIAGISEAEILFSEGRASVDRFIEDGDQVRPGDEVMSVRGDAPWILLAERTVLNIIGRMSGIATTTRKLSDLIAPINPHCRIAATRKTAPGSRLLDKKAVAIGGGDPHRIGLSDGILIKDNHLVLLTLEEAVHRIKALTGVRKIEVEVEDRATALRAAMAGVHIIMFDNMSSGEVKSTIQLLEEKGFRRDLIIEVSGGITLKNIVDYAACGVDLISLGSLTHSVKSLDVSLDVRPI